MLTSVILEQNVLQKWNILFCGLYNANEKIDAHIKSIRKVLKEFQEYKLITVRGKGYYLRIP